MYYFNFILIILMKQPYLIHSELLSVQFNLFLKL